MSQLNLRTLVLNQGYEPIRVVNWQRAVTMIWLEKASVLSEYDDAVHSKHLTWAVPAVIWLRNKAKRFVPEVKLTRHYVYARDGWRCFGEGTRILMGDGSQRFIEEVEPGNTVIDAFGHPQRVCSVGRHTTTDAVLLSHRGSALKTVTTKDHPYLIPSGDFVEIGEKPTHLVFPREVHYVPSATTFFDAAAFLSEERWLKIRKGRVYTSKRSTEVGCPTVIPVTAELAYVLGLLCAEGSSYLHNRGTSTAGETLFAFHKNERGTLARSVVTYFTQLGFKPTVKVKANTCRVRIGSLGLATILREFVGVGVHKKIPWGLIGSFHREFLAGLFRGDAYIHRNKHKVALQLVAPELIFGAQSMLWGLRMYPTLQHIKRKDGRSCLALYLHGQNYSRFMQLVLGIPVDNRVRISGDDTFVYRKLKALEHIKGEVTVYNLEITGSHSYIANGLAVHNCQYCGEKFAASMLTFDHVVPRARGGKTSWGNVVTCCTPCNQQKGDLTLKASGLTLLRKPRKPTWMPALLVKSLSDHTIPDQWHDFVGWLRPAAA